MADNDIVDDKNKSIISSSTTLLEQEDSIPQSVHTFLERFTTDHPFCSQCRGRDVPQIFMCARCQAARYCSRECQKRHFKYHKQACKHVMELRNKRKEHLESGKIDEARSVGIQMGHAIVSMGYRETDTVNNASFYYQKALRCYMESYQILPNNNSNNNNSNSNVDSNLLDPNVIAILEDCLLSLMAILGASTRTLEQFRSMGQMPPKTNEIMPLVAPQQLNDPPFLCMSLLSSMLSLATSRREASATTNKRQIPQDCAAQSLEESLTVEITQIINAMKKWGYGGYLIHLRDSIPLSPEHAPLLLRQGLQSSSNSGDALPVVDLNRLNPPVEFWYLYQDCFFLTPGANDVLHDFVPEEDDF